MSLKIPFQISNHHVFIIDEFIVIKINKKNLLCEKKHEKWKQCFLSRNVISTILNIVISKIKRNDTEYSAGAFLTS